METETTFIKPLLDSAEAYAKTSVELLKLHTLDKSASVASQFASGTVVFFFLTMFIFCINIAFALWLGELLGKVYFGFLVLALFYATLAAILYFFRYNWLKVYFNNAIISQVLD